MTIKIVTDSACDVPPSVAETYDVTIVPVYINIGEKSYLEGVDLTRAEFYENLYKYESHPTTAAPATGAFKQAYEKVSAGGATQILSMHLATSVSNIYNAARLGAEAADSAPVTLYDTQQITLGAGLQILLAAEAAAAGHTVKEIIAILESYRPKTRVFGMIDTLESLRRSGRVSWAEFGLGTLLQIKPIMMIHTGEVNVIAKVRTHKRSLKQMMHLVEEMSPFKKLAVIHVHAPEAAEEVLAVSGHLFPDGEKPFIVEVTPAVGTHLGLGAVGFACISE